MQTWLFDMLWMSLFSYLWTNRHQSAVLRTDIWFCQDPQLGSKRSCLMETFMKSVLKILFLMHVYVRLRLLYVCSCSHCAVTTYRYNLEPFLHSWQDDDSDSKQIISQCGTSWRNRCNNPAFVFWQNDISFLNMWNTCKQDSLLKMMHAASCLPWSGI